jgi:mannosyl-oligosaccharide alpha-1,2-mannosidase
MSAIIRLRRHRVSIAVAIILIIALYQFSTLRSSTSPSFFLPDQLKEHVYPGSDVVHTQPEKTIPEKPKADITEPKKPEVAPQQPEKITPEEPKADSTAPTKPADAVDTQPEKIPEKPKVEIPAADSQGSHQQPLPVTGEHPLPPTEHYSFPRPFYPVPSPLKKLPPIPDAAIPKIQAPFPPESPTAASLRLSRQKAVKDAFLTSWNAYRAYAIPHDELSPVTKAFTDPFGGWGATLVDALDTLWLMGLHAEFTEAVGFVEKIDFTTTTMRRMRVFETVIRYLGGLLAAYELSEQPVLLRKAVELADVLMGVFDTPNRMPLLQYAWQERDLKRHPRADTNSVAAELGTLSLEFTRLAMITGNDTYHDAVARITDALEEYQDRTSMPGLWPLYIDASGCKKVRTWVATTTTTTTEDAKSATETKEETEPKKKTVPEEAKSDINPAELVSEKKLSVAGVIGGTGTEVTPEVEYKPFTPAHEEGSEVSIHAPAVIGGTGKEVHVRRDVPEKPEPKCAPQGLAPPHLAREEKYSLGAMIDSLYEYLLKQHLLLGGNEQYARMYAKAMDVAGTELTYRPQVPETPDILLAGNVKVNLINGKRKFLPESSHLACFAGGMFAMGAKVLGRPKDLEVGEKLTDGCVWAYAQMRSGLMPESFQVMPCEDKKSCVFDREAWVKELEPTEEFAEKSTGHTTEKEHSAAKDKKPATTVEEPAPIHRPQKRAQENVADPKTAREYAEDLIEAEDLPDGFLSLNDRRYILRPEAIESVWYMYRITADQAWADKGWTMWEHLIQAVGVDGNGKGPASAVKDVTLDPNSIDWEWLNSLESFWFGGKLLFPGVKDGDGADVEQKP